MKIAQVTAYWGPAYPTGSGVFCYELSKRLAKQFEVHVFTSDGGNFRNLNNNVDNLYVHRLHTYATIWDMNPVANVFTRLLRGDFDIIHVHSYIFFLSNMSALARLFKRKSQYILHFHGGLDFSSDIRSFHPGRIWAKENIYDRTLGCFTTKLADRVLSASRNDIPIIQRKFGVKEVKWIPNAVDTEKFTPPEDKPSSPVVAYVGKLEKWKGIDTLIECFKIISKQINNVKFLVVGSGSLEDELKRTRLPIEFLGPVPHDEMPKIYQRTASLILPSYMEGFPVTCIEALSCEVPVVATNVGDVKEIILDGETGFVSEPSDSQGIASHTIKILKDKGLRKKLGENGRTHVKENFSYEAISDKIIEEYAKCSK